MTDKLDKAIKTVLELNLPSDPRWANLAKKNIEDILSVIDFYCVIRIKNPPYRISQGNYCRKSVQGGYHHHPATLNVP